MEVGMSDFEFWAVYAGLILVLLIPLAVGFWAMEKLAKRLGRSIIKFIRDSWEE
jgi:uncharacterized membrane protein